VTEKDRKRQKEAENNETAFQNCRDAGRKLAAKLTDYARRQDVVVLALPRGGVPVAIATANALDVPLDIFLVRKLGQNNAQEGQG
jgi:putative phosphoribosyl transferase